MKDWSLIMSKSQFDLAAALEKLREHDWLHPTVQFDEVDATLTAKNAGETKYADPNYWIAQCGHILLSNYKVSAREVARILSQSGPAMITRAIDRYNTADYKDLQSIDKALANYVEGIGLI